MTVSRAIAASSQDNQKLWTAIEASDRNQLRLKTTTLKGRVAVEFLTQKTTLANLFLIKKELLVELALALVKRQNLAQDAPWLRASQLKMTEGLVL